MNDCFEVIDLDKVSTVFQQATEETYRYDSGESEGAELDVG